MGVAEISREPAERWSQAVFVRPDAFTTYFDPGLLPAVAKLIRGLGLEPVVLGYRPLGKALHVHGFLEAFRDIAARERARLGRLTDLGRPIVGIDPSTSLLDRDEYRKVAPDGPEPALQLLQEWLHDVDLPTVRRAAERRRYRLLLHCTERTAEPRSADLWRDVFQRLGLELEVVDLGCCGMAGTYGHQLEHRGHSRQLYDMSWRRAVEGVPPECLLTTGYSCRSQVQRESGFRPAHPIEVMAGLLRQDQ